MMIMQRSTSSKSIKYRKLGFDRLTAYFLVDYMLPETMKMDFGEGTKEISSMRVFYATIVGLGGAGYFIGYGILYGLRDKTSYGNCTKNRDCRFGNGNDFYFPTVLLFAAIWTSL
jgi:K(+)-stimulated pyrophosphate-energized sodium pump